MKSRRRVLRSGLAVSLGALTLALGLPRAFAFRIEEDLGSPRALTLLSACETRAAHEQQLVDLIAQLEAVHGRAAAVETATAANCRLCGCRLSQAASETETPPRF